MGEWKTCLPDGRYFARFFPELNGYFCIPGVFYNIFCRRGHRFHWKFPGTIRTGKSEPESGSDFRHGSTVLMGGFMGIPAAQGLCHINPRSLTFPKQHQRSMTLQEALRALVEKYELQCPTISCSRYNVTQLMRDFVDKFLLQSAGM